MKIAVITDDGETISSHFGRARHFKIFAVEDNQITTEELVDKPFNTGDHHDHDHKHDHDHHHEEDHHQGGGHSPGKFKVIAGCEVLICGGMGEPAYQRAIQKGYQVYLTGGNIRSVVGKLLQGELESDMRRVHQH